MAKFEHEWDEDSQTMRLRLQRDFEHPDWEAVLALYRKHAEQVRHWVIDLCPLKFITSSSIGTLVGLNTSIRAYGSTLKVYLAENSRATHAILTSKVNLIIDMEVRDVSEKH